jgi:hypothetical protein
MTSPSTSNAMRVVSSEALVVGVAHEVHADAVLASASDRLREACRLEAGDADAVPDRGLGHREFGESGGVEGDAVAQSGQQG